MSFPDVQNLVIHNSTFMDVHNGQTGIDILRKASMPGAAYDDAARTDPPICFPGTREQYIEDFVHWAMPSRGDLSAPIYWMRGPAGAGKSAIAQTSAEKLKRLGNLGATFFFSADGLTKAEGFFPSIAYQLTTIHPAYRDVIDTKIRLDKTLVNKTIPFQFQYLIKEPLQKLEASGKSIGKRIVVFIDGLDECEGEKSQREIIHTIAAAVSDGTLPLCWAFFTRPELHIETTFSDPDVSPYCHKVILPISRDADEEIRLYLKNSFEDILRRCKASVHAQWPSAEETETLVSAAAGSFIYAATILRYVGHRTLSPQKRLRRIIEIILDHRKGDPEVGTSTDTPFAELDAFYTMVLQRIPLEIFPAIHLLLALICRRRASGVVMTANLLGLSKDEFESACDHASAVVHVQDLGKVLEVDSTTDTSRAYTQTSRSVLRELSRQIYSDLGGKVSFYHKSFTNFLLDPMRSGDYCVKGSEALMNRFIEIHLDYDRSFEWRGSELVLAPGVSNSASSLSYPHTHELTNSIIKACIYRTLNSEDSENFSAAGEVGGFDAACDFRKHLHVVTQFMRILIPGPSRPTRSSLWGCECYVKCYPGTYIAWIPRTGFSKFNVAEFKLVIKQRLQTNIIQPYHRSFTSWMKSLFHDGSQEHVESAIYRIGHGGKSTFWYWEINYELQHYREFRTTDLVKGQKVYQEENFGPWLWY